jgi:preprotein translocase subunit SecE
MTKKKVSMSNKQVTEDKDKVKWDVAAFIRETRIEIAKVTWPTRKETVLTTTMVVIMALIVGVFFLAVDSGLGFVISRILGMNS